MLSLGLFAESNIIRDYPFTELQLSNEWGLWYHWKVAKQIGIDLQDYWLLKKQEPLYKSNTIIITNIAKVDNALIKSYQKELKITKIKFLGIGAGVTAGTYLIVKFIFLLVTK